MGRLKYTIVVEVDEDGMYVASCPAIQGCYTQGKTYNEAIKNIKDAIKLHIEARKAVGEPVPIEQAVEEVEIIAEAAPSKA